MPDHLRLISTDFDGTLIGHPSDGRCVPELGHALGRFKESGGLWAVNTGRSLDHTVEGLEQFRAPVDPDFLITQERDIFRRDQHGKWSAFGDWNARAREDHARLFLHSTDVLAQIRSSLEGCGDLTLIEENGHLAGLVTSSEEIMEMVARNLDSIREAIPEFNYQRNLIYLRFCHRDYHKGSALGELSRLVDIPPESVFAVGDNFNDLSMLDARYARHIGCPANAISAVKAHVRRAGGHVASASVGKGVAEILDALIKEMPTAATLRARRQNGFEFVS